MQAHGRPPDYFIVDADVEQGKEFNFRGWAASKRRRLVAVVVNRTSDRVLTNLNEVVKLFESFNIDAHIHMFEGLSFTEQVCVYIGLRKVRSQGKSDPI